MSSPRPRRPLAWLLAAEAVSITGSRITLVAVPWLVLVTSGSPARAGVVAFAEMLPYVLAGALGGPFIDRWGAGRSSVGADVASGFVVAGVPLLFELDLLGFGVLLALSAAAGGLRGFGDTAKRALLPSAVDASPVPLERATAARDGIDRLSYLLGGAAGGVLIAGLGAANVLLIDAGSFFVAAVMVGSRVRIGQPVQLDSVAATVDPGPPAGPPQAEPYGAAFRAGLAYLRQDRLVLGIALMLLVTNLFDSAFLSVFIPVWAHDVVGSAGALGLVMGAFGAGAVAGNLVYTAMAPRLDRYYTFSVCFLLGGSVAYFVMAASSSAWLVAMVQFLAGAAVAPVNPILAAVVYERIPRPLQARVMGLIRAVAWGGIPLGGLLGGLTVESFGLTAGLIVAGSLYLVVTLVPFAMPGWRAMDAVPNGTDQTNEASGERRISSGDGRETKQAGRPGRTRASEQPVGSGATRRHPMAPVHRRRSLRTVLARTPPEH